MKVTITTNGQERTYPVDLDFTFEEADAMKEVAKIRVGEMYAELMRGDVMATLALAIVARMRAEPGFDPWSMRKDKIDAIVVDLTEDDEGPPAGAGERPAGASGAKRSRRNS